MSWYWRHRMGLLCDPLAAADLYALEHDETAPAIWQTVTSAVTACIYVAVDDAGACLYIGQCRPARAGAWCSASTDITPSRSSRPACGYSRCGPTARRRPLTASSGPMIRAYRPPFNIGALPGRVQERECGGDHPRHARARRRRPWRSSSAASALSIQAPGSLDPGSPRGGQRRITEFRRCGELRHAERYGWLSLVPWLLGMKASVVMQLDPTSPVITHRARRPRCAARPRCGDDPPPCSSPLPTPSSAPATRATPWAIGLSSWPQRRAARAGRD